RLGAGVRVSVVSAGSRAAHHVDKQHGAILTREGDDLLPVPAPALEALHGVGLPAEVAKILDPERHRPHVGAALGAGLGREAAALSVGPVGTWLPGAPGGSGVWVGCIPSSLSHRGAPRGLSLVTLITLCSRDLLDSRSANRASTKSS